MATSTADDFVHHCCELLTSVGRCQARRMFGGWGLSTDGLTLAIIADLGQGQKLWLKADATTRAAFEAAGSQRFTYASTHQGKAVQRGMDYYSAPEEAMDAPHAMAPWARLALQAALQARAAKPPAKKATPARKVRKPRP